MMAADRALKRHGHRLASNQVRYNLLDRRIETNGVLSTAGELGVTIIAYSPLAQGLLTGKFHGGEVAPRGIRRMDPHFRAGAFRRTQPLIDTMADMAQKYGVSIAQVALNWVITVPGDGVVAIPGATKVSHAVQNAGAMGWRLAAADRDALTAIAGEVSR